MHLYLYRPQFLFVLSSTDGSARLKSSHQCTHHIVVDNMKASTQGKAAGTPREASRYVNGSRYRVSSRNTQPVVSSSWRSSASSEKAMPFAWDSYQLEAPIHPRNVAATVDGSEDAIEVSHGHSHSHSVGTTGTEQEPTICCPPLKQADMESSA